MKIMGKKGKKIGAILFGKPHVNLVYVSHVCYVGFVVNTLDIKTVYNQEVVAQSIQIDQFGNILLGDFRHDFVNLFLHLGVHLPVVNADSVF